MKGEDKEVVKAGEVKEEVDWVVEVMVEERAEEVKVVVKWEEEVMAEVGTVVEIREVEV